MLTRVVSDGVWRQRGQVDAAQGRGILVVETGEHHLAARGAGRGGGAEHLSGARNFSVRCCWRSAPRPTCRRRVRSVDHVFQEDWLICQRAVEHSGLADAIHRVVALEHDGIAAGHRGRSGKYVEHRRRIEARNREELEVRDRAELAGAGDQVTEGVGVDARGPRPGLTHPSEPYSPYRLVVAARGDSVRHHVDAREGRGLDEFGVEVVGFGHQGLAVENPADGASGHSHVAGVDAVDGLVLLRGADTGHSPPPRHHRLHLPCSGPG